MISLNSKSESSRITLMPPTSRSFTHLTGRVATSFISVVRPRARWVWSVTEARSTNPSVALVDEPCTSTSRVNVVVGLGVSSTSPIARRSNVVRAGSSYTNSVSASPGARLIIEKPRAITVNGPYGGFEVGSELRSGAADADGHCPLGKRQVVHPLYGIGHRLLRTRRDWLGDGRVARTLRIVVADNAVVSAFRRTGEVRPAEHTYYTVTKTARRFRLLLEHDSCR